jgi:iron-sulfur cluster repair protein YtfE (RIC family)
MDGLADRDSLQRWWEEHSELDRLVADVEESLNAGRLEPARVALAALAEALENHFSVEERVYFPLVERFSPEHAAIVRGARLAHARVTESLDTLSEAVERGESVAARRALALVLDLFRRHEGEEAKLIAELELNQTRLP